jgi:hypothetical protein
MARINQINNVYNPDLKRLSSKLAFQIGENFSARVVKHDESAGEILLKLLDGWQFSAKLDKPLDFSPKGQLKFQIIGMEDGKVIIKLLQGESNTSKGELNSLLNILNNNNLGAEGYDILEKMLKHEIPLNKENISKVKSISDFLEKIAMDPLEEDLFIGKYLVSKSIDENSENGQFIKSKLKDFFSELKSVDMDDVLTLIENDIELNTENIGSFKRVFKTEGGLYNTLKSVAEYIKNEYPQDLTNNIEKSITSKENNQNTLNNYDLKEVIETDGMKINIKQAISEAKSDNNKTFNNIDAYSNVTNSKKNLNKVELLKSMLKDDTDMTKLLTDIEISGKVDLEKAEISDIEKLVENYNKSEKKEPLMSKGVTKLEDALLGKGAIKPEEILLVKELIESEEGLLFREINKYESDDLVQNLIKDKTQELRDIVKSIVSLKNGAEKEVLDKVMDFIKPTINDIKVFNTVNNQYYYMDIPINLKEQEYPCKLIIKDERNRGKKIDSKNVNMIISIKTVNMGDVDSFIKVRDNNMSIDIKCIEKWIKTFENTKEKLINGLGDIGYSLFINFEKREEAIDISSCREFFNDSSFNNINVKV